MAVAFRAAGTPVLDTTAGPTVVAYPAGVAANDLLLIQYRVASVTAVTTPAGWTKLFGPTLLAGSTLYAYVFWRVAGGSEPSTVSITKPNAASMAVMSAYSGCDTTTPIDVSATAALATSGTTYTSPTVTTTKANTRVLRMYWPWCFSGSGTTPNAADTERYDRYDSWDGGVHELADRAQAAAGATGTSNATGPALNGGLAATIALAPFAAVAPVANFTGTPLSGTEPLAVTFTDSSTNTPTSWAWTFGDGGTSTSQNPSHTYATAGTYTVALTATNSAGSNTLTRTGYITVADQPRPVRINTSQGWRDIADDTSFVSGSGAPTAAVGATGAIYLNTATGLHYGPKAGGAWPGTALPVPGGGSPAAHAATHQPGGTDAMAVDAAAATGSLRTLGTGAQQAAAGNDPRFPSGKVTHQAWATGPPASPANGDIWIATGVAAGVNWQFRYNSGSASAYKWEYIGGVPLWVGNTGGFTTSAVAAWTVVTGGNWTVGRSGNYLLHGSFYGTSSATNAGHYFGYGKNSTVITTLGAVTTPAAGFLFVVGGLPYVDTFAAGDVLNATMYYVTSAASACYTTMLVHPFVIS